MHKREHTLDLEIISLVQGKQLALVSDKLLKFSQIGKFILYLQGGNWNSSEIITI